MGMRLQTIHNLNLVDIVTIDHASLKEVTPVCITIILQIIIATTEHLRENHHKSIIFLK